MINYNPIDQDQPSITSSERDMLETTGVELADGLLGALSYYDTKRQALVDLMNAVITDPDMSDDRIIDGLNNALSIKEAFKNLAKELEKVAYQEDRSGLSEELLTLVLLDDMHRAEVFNRAAGAAEGEEIFSPFIKDTGLQVAIDALKPASGSDIIEEISELNDDFIGQDICMIQRYILFAR